MPVTKWLQSGKFSDRHLGAVTGRISDIAVVDLDDDLLAWALDRFGLTPLIATSPSGGWHLYYRYNGEGSQTGIFPKVDIRGDGGYIVLPPSQREDGSYEWYKGDWNDFPDLPKMREGGIPPKTNAALKRSASTPAHSLTLDATKVPVGHRNDTLFRYLQAQAFSCDSEVELLQLAYEWNARLLDPLENEEVARTAFSIQRMRDEGRLYQTRDHPSECVQHQLLRERLHDAHTLYSILLMAHRDARKRFALSAMEMAKSIGWTTKRLRNARTQLEQKDIIRCVKKGGLNSGANEYEFLCL